MAKKPPSTDPVKAKEAKQKKIAIGGGVILVILLAIQVPKVMKQMHHSAAPPPPPATTAATTTPAVPPTGVTTPDAGSGQLLSASAPTAALGHLTAFSRFASKDPFAAQGPAAGSTSAKPTSKKGGTDTTPTPPTPPTPPSSGGSTTPAQLTSAVIAVNGVKTLVQVGTDFPESQPFFHLVSLTETTAKISIAGGSLANGAPTITLSVNKPVTLMNTSDGTRYKLELLPQGTVVSTSAAGSTATTPATTTAPATTTTKP